MLSEVDAAWFREHPSREFRCRHLTAAEHAPQDDAPAGSTAVRLIYVRKSDGATAKTWTPSPDLLLSEVDEGRARFAAQGMPNPPPLDGPFPHVETIPVSPETATYLKVYMAEHSIAERR